MVISNSQKKINNIKVLSLHGMTKDAWKRFSSNGYKHYSISDVGFKNNMTDIAAALGIIQLNDIGKNWMKRRALWNRYYSKLVALPIKILKKPSKNIKHAYHLFPIFISEKKSGVSRDKFITELHKRNIGVGVHYKSIASYPLYIKKLKLKKSEYKSQLSLEMKPYHCQ